MRQFSATRSVVHDPSTRSQSKINAACAPRGLDVKVRRLSVFGPQQNVVGIDRPHTALALAW
jgi:uncharacterized protein YhdP